MRLKDEKFYKTVRDFLDIYLIKHRSYSLNTQKSYREAINLLLLYFKTELGLEYQYWVRGHHLLKYNRFSRMALKIQRMFSSNGKSAFDGNSFFHKICRDIRFRQNLYAGRSRQHFCSENSGKSRGVSDGSCIGNSF